MNEITTNYLSRAEIVLFITILAYFLLNGAQIFETAVLVPKWSAAPPDSFHYFKGNYGLDLKTFWIVAHSIHEITYILAIIFCWKVESVRNWLLVLFAAHFTVRAWTILYFAPNIINFQSIANGKSIEVDLVSKTIAWKNLNYLRVGVYVLISFGLIPLYFRIMNLKIAL